MLVLAASKYNYTSIATNCLPMCLYFLPIFIIISIYIIDIYKKGGGGGVGGGVCAHVMEQPLVGSIKCY